MSPGTCLSRLLLERMLVVGENKLLQGVGVLLRGMVY